LGLHEIFVEKSIFLLRMDGVLGIIGHHFNSMLNWGFCQIAAGAGWLRLELDVCLARR